jgi:hypothetical protein
VSAEVSAPFHTGTVMDRNPTICSVPDVELRKGQNATLPPEVTRLRLVVTWEQGGQDVDASALLLGEDGRVRSDEDFVFYNQPSVPDGSVTYLGGTSTESGSQQGLAVTWTRSRPGSCTSSCATSSTRARGRVASRTWAPASPAMDGAQDGAALAQQGGAAG